jgi:hypothetical protein
MRAAAWLASSSQVCRKIGGVRISSMLTAKIQILIANAATSLGFAQGEFAGHGAALVVRLHDDGGLGQSGFIDLDRDLGSACGVVTCPLLSLT